MFNILWCRCGPGFNLREIVIEVRVWVQDTYSVITKLIYFLLVNQKSCDGYIWQLDLSTEHKGGYMDKDGCGSGGLRNVSPSFYLKNMVLSVY